MKLKIALFAAALLALTLPAFCQSDFGISEYAIRHFTPYNGLATNAVLRGQTTNLLATIDSTRHAQFTLIWSTITMTNQAGVTNTATLELTDLLSDSTTAVPGLRPAPGPKWAATMTCIGAANTRVTNTLITNITVDTVGYQRYYAKINTNGSSAAIIFTNIYTGYALKPYRSGND